MSRILVPALGLLLWTTAAGAFAPATAPGLLSGTALPATTLPVAGDGGHPVPAAPLYRLGDLEIAAPFTRATLPNAPVAGGFLSVTNSGASDDRLIGAASTVAGRVEVHEMAMQGDVMKMRELPDGLPIPAGKTVDLRPGGFHLMFMQLQQPLVEGQTVTVTLRFEKAGEITIEMPVGASNAREAAPDGHHGGAMSK